MDEKQCQAHELRLKELEMKIERLQDHHSFYKQSITDGLDMASKIKIDILDLKNSVNWLRPIREKVDLMEMDNAKKGVWNDVFKTVVGIIIGLLVAHFIREQVIAISNDKFKTEQR